MAIKTILGIIWVWAALCLFVPLPFAGLGRGVFWILLIVHLIEFAIFLPKLRQAPGSLGHHFVQVLFFGVAHMRELQKAQEA